MNTKSRIASVLQANPLGYELTGIPVFDLTLLQLPSELDVTLPTNLRLGHLVEKIVAELIKKASNYKLLFDNIQIIDDKKTIGELDFIIQEKSTNQIYHLELAYKFYLYDPTISSDALFNWIGPNRNDSLHEKLKKLKEKQLPLLFDERTRETLKPLSTAHINQVICFLTALYLPFNYEFKVNEAYTKGIKGYYLNFETFKKQHSTRKKYYLPQKTEWGMEPNENDIWQEFNTVEQYVSKTIEEKQAPLCWQNHNGLYSQFFIVWW